MLFINNKYTRIYYSIISNAQSRTLPESVYTEKHHIIPKSLGGSNAKDNLVALTAREHFICHWLLTKMVLGEQYHKMMFALNRMLSCLQTQERYKITSRKFELIKIAVAQINPFNDPLWQYTHRLQNHCGKTRSIETKQKLKDTWTKNKESRTGLNHPLYGKHRSHETKQKISISLTGKMTGNSNPFYGKTHTEQNKEKFAQRLKENPMPKKFLYCEHCCKDIDAGNFKRWHGDKCKLKN